MKLLVDMGNTRTKAVLVHNGLLQPVEYSLSLFEQYDISKLVYASVRHNREAEELKGKALHLNIDIHEIQTAAEAFGVQCGYGNYRTLGIDRWLAVLGAVSMFPSTPLVIVDAGTATTVDFVVEKSHRGGWIVPGLDLMVNSVTDRTDKVFNDSENQFHFEVGTETPAALRYGCFAAQLGVVAQAMTLAGKHAKLLLTGGAAPAMSTYLEHFSPSYEELLVFKGMDLYGNDP